MNKKATLIDDIIQFIKTERDLYGDFDLPDLSSQPNYTNQPETNKMTQTASKEDKRSAIEACTTLDELKELCANADELKTDLNDTKLVFGDGDPNANLVVIGEAPGAKEDELGKPFVGRAGKMLDKILDAAEFDRDEIYISNILKHRPPNNRNPLPEERQRSLPYLLHQIDLIEPKIILTLGKVSALTLLDESGSLKSKRGRFHPFRDKYELLCTYHPAALLRNSNWKRPTWDDFKMLRKRYDELVS